jgi:hypothetical protein
MEGVMASAMMIDPSLAMALWASTILRSDLPTRCAVPLHPEKFTLDVQSSSTMDLEASLAQ